MSEMHNNYHATYEQLQGSLLQAIQTLTDSSVAHSKATMTVKAEITEVVSISQGIYKARYLNDSLTVYAMQGLEYSVGNIVYILIPDGNFSNKKLILSNAAVVDEVSVQIGESTSADEYYDISENFFANFNNTIQLCSYKTSNGGITLSQIDRAAKEKIIEYLKYYNTFYFGATIQTALDATQKARNGKYGIKLSIPLKGLDEETSTYWKEIQIDPSNILGNPYALEVPTPQSITFSIDTTKLTYDSKRDIIITYFSEAGEDSFLPGKNKPADIFLTDIIFKTIEALPESIQQGYSLTINATQGTLFTDNGSVDEVKTLTPTVRYNGNKITLRSDTICYWFVEDASINARSKGYVSYAGAGWRCLNEVDGEGNPVSALSKEVAKNDLVKELKYKCVIIYDKNVISNTITLVNVNSSIELKLETSTGSTLYPKTAKEVELRMIVMGESTLANISFSWSRKDKNGQLVEVINSKTKQPEPNADFIIEGTPSIAKLPILLIDELTTVSCTVIKDDGTVRTVLGTKSLTITIGEKQTPQYRLVINNGDRVYKYDSDGDSPMIANYDGPLSSVVSAIKPLTYQIFRADGTEFTETDYRLCSYTWKVPKNSLIQIDEDNVGGGPDHYRVSGNGGGIEGNYTAQLNYKIASKFNNNKSDNNITLEVKFNDVILEEKTNMFFLKEGASGTNGTKYAAVITYDGYGYRQQDTSGREQKLRMYYTVKDNTWYFSKSDNYVYKTGASVPPLFKILVYEDGEILSSGNYTVSYSMFDKKNLNPIFRVDKNIGRLGVSIGVRPSLNNLMNIVQATITITKNGTESSINSETVLYAYYPIEVTMISGDIVFSSSPCHIDTLCYLTGGFSEVVYATDGTNPQYDSSIPFEYKNYSNILQWVHNVNNGHLTIREIEENVAQRKYVPDSKYDDGNTRNYVYVRSGDYATIQPIVFLYNRYEMSNLNGWDGNKLYLDDAGNYILAPQIGAGVKHTDNSFTGVVMGIKKITGSTNTDVGLFGYGQGKQTMFLNAKDGGFTFGNNQIVFTPEDEKMELNNIVLDVSAENDEGIVTGVIIDPLNKNENADSYIFKVHQDGKSLVEITPNKAQIAGFNITDQWIESSDGRVGIGTTKDWAFWAGLSGNTAKFRVAQDGSATIGNLSINSNGDIAANGGTFTGITVNGNSTFSGKLSGATGTFSGELSAASGTFKGTLSGASGTFSGELNAASGTFKGTLSAATGSINSITATNLTVTSGKISLGNTVLSSSSSDTSTIGGWTIGAKSLTSGSVNSNNFIGLYSSYDGNENYRIVVGNKKFTVDREGYMIANSGVIGGLAFGSPFNGVVVKGLYASGDEKKSSCVSPYGIYARMSDGSVKFKTWEQIYNNA